MGNGHTKQFLEGTFTSVERLICTGDPGNGILELGNGEIPVSLGRRRRIHVGEDSVLIYEKDGEYQLFKLVDEVTEDVMENDAFSLPKFLKKQGISFAYGEADYYPEKGKWYSALYRTHMLYCEYGRAELATAWFDGREYSMYIDFSNRQIHIGGNRLTYWRISNITNDPWTEEVIDWLKEAFYSHREMSWKEFAKVLESLGLGGYKKWMSFQLKSPEGEVFWKGWQTLGGDVDWTDEGKVGNA